MAMTDLTIVRKSLISRWFATATTVLTVGVAVAILLVLISMREAGETAFVRGTGNMHLIVSGDTSPLNSVLNTVFYAGAPARKVPTEPDWLSKLRADPRVEWALPVVQGDNFHGFPTIATEPDYFDKFTPAPKTPWALAAGRYFQKQQELVLGSEAAARTGLKIGDSLAVTHGTDPHGTDIHTDFPFTVVGVLKPTQTSHDRGIFMNLTSVWLMHAHDLREEAGNKEEPTAENLRPDEKPLTGIYVRVRGRPGSNTPPTLGQIFSELRADPTITVAQPGDQVKKLFQIVGKVDQIIFAMAAAVLVSTAITIMLVLYQAMLMRRRQIAVLRVLGASRGRVFMLVLTEAAVIGLLSAALGVLAAVGGMHLIAGVMQERLNMAIEPSLSLLWLLAIAGGTVLLSSLAGLLPAVTAYRTQVIANLKPIG